MASNGKEWNMAYSRWLTSEWYTYWQWQKAETETRDNATFTICEVCGFTAKELRDDMDQCLKVVDEHTSEFSDGDLNELKGYMMRFLKDVDSEYEIS